MSTGKIGKVPLSYLVCATERSGSTLLCELLSGTGVAGRPEEYFEFLSATGRPRQPREYFEESAEIAERLPPLLAPCRSRPGSSAWPTLASAAPRPTASSAAKMMWAYLPDFLSHGTPGEQLGEPLHWVYVERERQAQAGDLAVARDPDRPMARGRAKR